MATTTAAGALYRPATTQWTLPCGPLTSIEYGSGSFTNPYTPSAFPTLASSCGPSGWYDTSRPSGSTRIIYMSPAICPSGYTVACTWYSRSQGPIPTSDEEAWNCLPTGYACNATRFGTHGANTVSNTVSDWAPMIAIRWASRDLSLLETHPLTPGLFLQASTTSDSTTGRSRTSTSGSSGTGTSTSTSISTASPAESGGSSSLTAGAIAGIVVGVIFGLALLAAIASLFIYRRRRQAQNPPAGTSEIQPQFVPYTKPGEKPAVVGQVHEIDSSRGPWGPVELPVDASSYGQPAPSPNQQQQYYYPYPAPSTAPSQNQSEYALGSPSYVNTVVDRDAESPIPVSPSPAAASITETEPDELERLRNRQSQLVAKRERLLQLQEVDEEEQRVLRRIEELERGGRP